MNHQTICLFRCNKPGEKKSKRPLFIAIPIIILIILGGVLTTTFSQFQLDPEAIDEPFGKIHSPGAGSVTSCEVKVTAGTRNLKPGQYVWLAIDKPTGRNKIDKKF